MKLFIIDLEATCYNNNPPTNFFSEIIEIGGIMFDLNRLEIITEYQCFVKPILFPILSPFCKELTSINQEQVDQGITIADAVQKLRKLSWQHQAVFCSWGHYDRKQFKRVCDRFKLIYPFSSKHINLKLAHSEQYNVRKMGMKGALTYHKLPLHGTHHRGIDDARNITTIVRQMIADGCNLKNHIKNYY